MMHTGVLLVSGEIIIEIVLRNTRVISRELPPHGVIQIFHALLTLCSQTAL